MSRSMSGARGFTLIEVMVSVAIMGILGALIAGSLVAHHRLNHREIIYSEAQQNGRAAADILKTVLRKAGAGLIPDVAATGLPPIGGCYKDGDTAETRWDCDGIDDGSDRIRLSYGSFYGGTTDETWLPGQSWFRIAEKTDPKPLGFEDLVGQTVLISGVCTDGTHITQYVTITAKRNTPQHHYGYDFTPNFPCLLDKGFNVMTGWVEDYYIDRSDAENAKLMLNRTPADQTKAMVVANYVDDLQIEYGIDTDATPDHVLDVWCHDPNDTIACSTGYSSRENFARVIAVRGAVVVRASEKAPSDSVASPDLNVLNNVIPADDYRRWIYRFSVALRNNEI